MKFPKAPFQYKRNCGPIVSVVIGQSNMGFTMWVSDLAGRMMTEYGLSEKLGSVRYAGQGLQYLGSVLQDDSQISPVTRALIDAEVQRTVTEHYLRAHGTLLSHRAALESLTAHLPMQ